MSDAAASDPRIRSGVIGLGMIGGAIAANLVAADVPTSVYDVRPDAYRGIAGISDQAATPREVADRSDVVIIAVVNAAQARSVLSGPDGLLAADAVGKTFVLVSTVAIPAVLELAALCEAQGATLLDAGVTQAGEGKLVVMLGGSAEAADRAAPVLAAFSRAVVHCGDLGAGMITKLARNTITYGSWAVVREAATLMVAGGVDPQRVLEAIEAAGAEGANQLLHLRIARDQGPLPEQAVTFAAGLADKDLAAAQEYAGAHDLETPLIDLARPRMRKVFEADYDTSLPAEPWERGTEMMRRVYGSLSPVPEPTDDNPAISDIVEHLFGRVWARGNLSMRDRRLLALGATAMLGRQDLLEVQFRGAIDNGELTTPQLREIEHFLNYYAGVENGAAVLTVVEQLLAEAADSAAAH